MEGVISQAAYALNDRRTCYRGLAKTHLQNLVIAAAINLRRGAHWLLGKETASIPINRFAALTPASFGNNTYSGFTS